MPRLKYFLTRASLAFLALYLFAIALAVIGWDANVWKGSAVVVLGVFGTVALIIALWDIAKKEEAMTDLADLIKASLTVFQPSSVVANISRLSSTQIRALVSDLTGRMRALEGVMAESSRSIMGSRLPYSATVEEKQKASRERMEKLMAQRAKENAEFRENLLPDALAVRDEMFKRLGIMEPYPHNHRIVALDYGMLAGINPISEAAGYLESLARRLPP